jgi:hypothetical protein
MIDEERILLGKFFRPRHERPSVGSETSFVAKTQGATEEITPGGGGR